MAKSGRRWLLGTVLIVAVAAGAAPDSPLFVPNFLGPGGYYEGLPARYWQRRLRHRDVEARRRAAKALGALGADAGEAVPDLAAAMLDDADRGVRVEAALALTKMGPAARAALPALIRAVEDHDPVVRLNATLTLSVLRGDARPAVPALRRAVRDERNRSNGGVFSITVQELAALALGRATAGSAEAVPDLLDLLKAAERPETREAVARALGEIGPAAAPAVPRLRALVVADREDVVQAAAEALRKIEGGRPGP